MNKDRIKSDKAGRLVRAGQGDNTYWAFVPNQLPPDLSTNNPELLLAIAEAHSALGELSGIARTIPNPKLLMQPFIRREAVLSSMIEGTVTSVTELYAYEAGQPPIIENDPPTPESDKREVLNYVRALQYGIERLETLPLSLRLAKEIHGLLMQGVRGGRAYPGEFRRSQNWIGGSTINAARYVPPPVHEMNEALDSLEKYLHAPHEYPPLVRLAFIHYQFEAIHPFVDGNGRTGRLLMALLMVHWQLLSQPMINLSAFFEKNRREYYDHLLAVSERGEWEEWVHFVLYGVIEQAREAIELAEKLQQLQVAWRDRLVARKVHHSLFGLADKLFDTPLITIRAAQEILGVNTYNTARTRVQHMVDAGILKPVEGDRVVKLFAADEILSLVAEDYVSNNPISPVELP